MKQKKPDTRSILQIDAAAEVERIAEFLRTQLGEVLHRRGLVIAMSGGIDSSVCAALAVQAVGPKRVFGLFMPERDSDPLSLQLATQLAEQLGIAYEKQDIAPILEAAGCYRRRDDAIRRVVPEYGEGWASKIILPGDRLDSDRLNVYYLAVRPPGGEISTVRLSPTSYLEIVAATNFKQRVRKMLEYHHGDRLHYAVMGSPNRLEYDQGFFVKGGDGLADVKPIAHLYKTQVYQLADYLGVPAGITSRPPTTDTYSLPQTQEEFYFSLPALTMDLVLYALNHGWSAEVAAEKLGLQPDQVTRAYADIEQKRSTTDYLHTTSLLVEPVSRVRSGA
ncbi:MAG TPA: NAD(+) synthase [Longimicrobiales bacterium]|nr:NAD(+) synthase [Longimicrobiales bacterium]